MRVSHNISTENHQEFPWMNLSCIQAVGSNYMVTRFKESIFELKLFYKALVRPSKGRDFQAVYGVSSQPASREIRVIVDFSEAKLAKERKKKKKKKKRKKEKTC